jgi:hypothetical protein
MDPELKRLLEENLAVSKDNNAVLRAMRHHQWLSSLTSIIFWVVVVALPIYLYQQYLAPLMSVFTPGATTTSPFNFPTSAQVENLIKSYRITQ